ncbi:disco-interacting protein 2 homolog C-like [Lineus longissimus]|uniref:disco-interacting protein 2 homolog C-like n=1 Tax=Lineus longissimus TaxID=88925 RepID=UPI002B4FA583
MADYEIDESQLPQDVRKKIAELELELSEGDITQKGYDKKRARLLAPFVKNTPEAQASNKPSPSTAAQRRAHRRLTREDNRYHSEIRTEAVMQALAMHSKKVPVVPMPSKRTSAVYGHAGQSRPRAPEPARSDSSSDDDSSVFEEDQSRSSQHSRQYERRHVDQARDRDKRDSLPTAQTSSGYTGGGYNRDSFQGPSNQARSALADVMQNTRRSQHVSQPPDVTSNTNTLRKQADRVQRYGSQHAQSVRMTSSGVMSGMQTESEMIRAGKVSAKIQQLLNTLKRPKRKPLREFFLDEEDVETQLPPPDPNAPKPEGSIITPALGEQLVVPTGLPRNLESALQRYGSASYKATAITALDPNGKPSITLTYGKLLSRSQKIAYNLLNKMKGDACVKSGDRVALVYPNNDPLSFTSSFYGCLMAGVVPVPVEVPTSKRDAGSNGIGFLLGSLSVSVALTSEPCYKGLPRIQSGEVMQFKGWPRLHWFVTEHLSKPPRDWLPPPRLSDETPAYVEYTTGKDGSVMGVTVTRANMLNHSRTLTVACNYTEGEVMVCVLDFKRDVGLWHGVLTSIFNGMHVIFIPYSLMKIDPASWMKMITKFKASIAVVKSRDMHWGLLAQKDHKDINFHSLRMLLVADGANPWSLTSCDSFLSVFQNKGLRPEAICPCASSAEGLTVSVRRPGKTGSSATGRGVLSMQGLSYGVVRVDSENSLTSLTLQDCGQVMPGAMTVVVKTDGQPYLCKTDEVGEICLSSGYTGTGYWGLQGVTNSMFKVQALMPEGNPISEQPFVRTGLLGFLGPGGLIFICGSRDGLMTVGGRRHNTDDIIATVLAVEPMKFIYRGRIAVFSVRVLKDERIIIIAEQRPDCSEEESFQWMSRVLQAVDSIHQVGVYCLALVPPNYLPKTPLGGIHLHEAKKKFLEGSLHPANLLMCPHTCVTNLPKPREIHSSSFQMADVGPSAVMVGNIVQGARLAYAQGRDIGVMDEESEGAKRYQFLSEILRWRSMTTSDHMLFSLINAKGAVGASLTCIQLHKKAERIGCLLLEKGKLNTGDHVALIFSPGLDLIAAFYGCLYVGCVPVTVRPPHPQNISTTLPTARMVVEVSKSVAILTNAATIKLLKSKEASAIVDAKTWPTVLDTDDTSKKKLTGIYRAPTPEMLCYLDFSVSTTGMLAGVKMSHAATSALCRSQKLQCELYPSRDVALCLDPYCGLGFVLWCLSSIYSGHHSILIPPSEVEANPAAWLTTVSQHKVRDTFCSYGVMELCSKGLGTSALALKQKGVNLSCVRTLVVIAEERPRIALTSSFSKLFSSLGLSPRAVSTSFGCRVNVGICLQGASSPDTTSVYVDMRALRNDRVALVEKGSPNSMCLMESGKLLPGVKVIIANPETKGQCADSHLGEIWVACPHNASGYFTIYGEESLHADHFNARLATGDIHGSYARTGFLGFIRRTELTQSDGERHDAMFVVGALDETVMLRNMRFHPIDIENSVLRCHRKICECAVFTWTNLLVVVVELDGNENEALDLVPLVTNAVLEDNQLVVGVVVVVDPGVVPINSRGEKQRMHLRDGFLADQLDPIYVAYNM